MPDFGHHGPYIYASYGAAALILIGLIVASLAARAAARRRLAALEGEEKRR
jgi:heme exporter protein CcmD